MSGDRMNVGGNGAAQRHLQLPLSVEFGEPGHPQICNGCSHLGKAGMMIVVANKLFFVCVKCLAGMVYKYQKLNPGETIIEVDTHIESSQFSGQLEACIDNTLRGYNVSGGDRSRLVDAIQRVFDGDKFNELPGEKR
jgi:hypothetical protein